MLSICIPTYNYDIIELVNSLQKQAESLTKQPIEILVIDDCSNDNFQTKNRGVQDLYLVHYEELSQNIGRSKIRNLFIQKSQYPFLLFIDCDMKMVDDQFLERYISFCTSSTEIIVCGGLAYEVNKPDTTYELRWKYGHYREVRNVKERLKNPNYSFMTSNFLIAKSIFQKLQFNESITEYGHEDTLFGLELANQGIQITHIHNPLYHLGIETNEVFLEKTEQGIKNLNKLYQHFQHQPDFVQQIALLKAYHKLKSFHIHFFFKIAFLLFEKILYRNLTKGSKSLLLFDLYKLGILLKVKSK